MNSNPPKEEIEQMKLIQWLKANKYNFFAPINEQSHSFLNKSVAIIQTKRAKLMGLIPGVSDIVIFLDSKILFIEMKRQPKTLKSGKLSYTNSKTSEEQVKFLNNVNKYDYAKGFICYGFDEAVKIIKENE